MSASTLLLPMLPTTVPEASPFPSICRNFKSVTNGARTRDLLSSATFRCRPLQSVLMHPVIGLVLVFFGDTEDYLCSLRTILCASSVAVR
jgi:hypothetical protein